MDIGDLKIGVLFSHTGPMAVTENAHLQGILLACDEINSGGGIDGRLLVPIILDPGGSDERYAEMATELLVKHRVNAIFGTCLSTSRKAVLPIIERFNGVLFYPSVYEGFEYSPNVIYGGAVPNQVVLPLLEFISQNLGNRIALLGSETLYAREVNRIVNEFLGEGGWTIVSEKLVPISAPKGNFCSFLEGIKDKEVNVIISTVVGEDSLTLYNAFHELGMNANKIPIASLTTTESELARMIPRAREGHLSVAPYFASLEGEANQEMLRKFRARFGQNSKPSVYSEVCYSQVHMFANAIRHSGSDEVELLLSALSGAVFKSPGGDLFQDIETNHCTVRPLIGKANVDGDFDIIWRGANVVVPDPYLVAYDRTVKGRMTG